MHEKKIPSFRSIHAVRHPKRVMVDAATGLSPKLEIDFEADGPIPFPQVIVWTDGRPHIFPCEKLHHAGEGRYRALVPAPKVKGGLKVRFGIHKHMHQPYYRAADPQFWDDEKTMIFDQRAGPYSAFIPDAVRQYVEGGLAHASLSTSWSGSLIEQLERCERESLCYGHYERWAEPWCRGATPSSRSVGIAGSSSGCLASRLPASCSRLRPPSMCA